jgi:crotonobetainyl-CoA:carnitine CoA-transferase CaiB-like acyl-CoA transferase
VTGRTLLSGLRVLDFAAEPLAYAGRIFVELGAEVILVEPPGGAPLRRSTPLVNTEYGEGHGKDAREQDDREDQQDREDEQDREGEQDREDEQDRQDQQDREGEQDREQERDRERVGESVSATFFAYAAGKRSVTIDWGDPSERSLLDELLATADVALMPGDPVEAERLGLDEARLRSLHPSLVTVSATPFGLTGPRSSWRGSDATAWAASGINYLMGDADRPPVVAPVGLSNALTSLNAAMGALLAIRSERRHGGGQLVDISMQEAVLSASMEAGPQLVLEGRAVDRVPRVRLAGVGIFASSGGAAVDVNAFLPGQWDALADWIAIELGIEEAQLDVFRGGILERMTFTDLITTWIVELAGRYTKQEFFLEAQRRGIPCGPVNEAEDLAVDHQLNETHAWDQHPADEAPEFRLPRGPLAVDGQHPVAGAIPSVGEHNADILDPLR